MTETDVYADMCSEFSGPAVMHKHPGYVYLLECGGRYKIGLTQNVEKRLKQIEQRQKQPVHFIYAHFTQNCGELERRLLRRFEKKHFDNEWFALNEDDVRVFCAWKEADTKP